MSIHKQERLEILEDVFSIRASVRELAGQLVAGGHERLGGVDSGGHGGGVVCYCGSLCSRLKFLRTLVSVIRRKHTAKPSCKLRMVSCTCSCSLVRSGVGVLQSGGLEWSWKSLRLRPTMFQVLSIPLARKALGTTDIPDMAALNTFSASNSKALS